MSMPRGSSLRCRGAGPGGDGWDSDRGAQGSPSASKGEARGWVGLAQRGRSLVAESGAPEPQREDGSEQGRALWDAQTHGVSAAPAGQAAPPPMVWPAHSVQRSLGWLSHWRGLQAGTCCPGPGAHRPRLLHRGAGAASLPSSGEETGPWSIRRKPWTDPPCWAAVAVALWGAAALVRLGHTLLPSRGLLGAGTLRP